MLAERRLDLAQLDAHAAHLDLAVGPPQVLDLAPVPLARQVPGAVEPGAGNGRERIGEEAFGGQLGAAEIAAGGLDAADPQLPRHPGRHRRQGNGTTVEEVDAGVGDRPADGDREAPDVPFAGPGGDVDRRLGGAVEIGEPGFREEGEEALDQGGGQGLAARDHPRQRGAASDPRLGEEGLEHRGDEVDGRDLALGDRPYQVGRVLVPARPGEDEPGAGEKRPEELPDRDVEAHRGLLEDVVASVEPIALLHPEQPVEDRPVAVHGPLRGPRGAGGVEDVGEVVRAGR